MDKTGRNPTTIFENYEEPDARIALLEDQFQNEK
jgi:hypothetical protein